MKNKPSDERLAVLAKKSRKKFIYILYKRYKKYGYTIIDSILKKTYYYNSLIEEKDAILLDTIVDCIDCYKKDKGSFRGLFISIITHRTYKVIGDFSNNPLSDYVSIDSPQFNGDIIFADSENSINYVSTPSEHFKVNELKNILSNTYRPKSKKIQNMIQLKKEGYSYIEIAKKYKVSPAAVRQLFYRIRGRYNKYDK